MDTQKSAAGSDYNGLVRTADGHEVILTALVEQPGQLKEALAVSPGGIGLLDTDQLLCMPGQPGPRAYRQLLNELVQQANSRPVVVKTCARGLEPENSKLLEAQLQIITEAAAGGNVQLALAGISHVSQVQAVKELLSWVREQVEQLDRLAALPAAVGIMAEAPSVFLMADTIAQEVRFFIVTEEVLHHTLAAWGRPYLGHLLQPFAAEFLIQSTTLIETAHRRHKQVAFRVSSPPEPALLLILVGLGYDEIIVPPENLAHCRNIIGRLQAAHARLVAAKTVSFWHPEKARDYAREAAAKYI